MALTTPLPTTPLIAALCGLATLAVLRWAVWRGFRAPCPPVTASPADFGLCHDDVSIPTANGKRLAGWLIPAAAGAPLVVVMHGWGVNATAMLPLAAVLHRRGLALLLLDARSHGRSDPDTFSSMPRFAEDIDAALDWLAARWTGTRPPMAVLGHSVGGAAALLAASRRRDIDAVVSLSAFDHPLRVMRATLARAHIPFHPFGWLICRYVERVIGARFDAIAPVATIGRVRCPVLVGHGTEDDMVSPDAARAIAAAAPATARLVLLDGAGHEGPADYDDLADLLTAFLTGALTACPRE